jgi:Ca2+-transporting ATPase
VTLATAAIPEEFPVVFTFFLGVGVYRLAKRQALVRRAVSVENIGRVSCICSDKTGTITEGRLHLTHLVPSAGVPEERLLLIASLAARRESGDPIDSAIFHAWDAAGTVEVQHAVVTTFPFTEDRKRETAVVRDQDGQVLVATKGAAEVVLGLSTLSETDRSAWERETNRLAEGGHKVIAVASRPLDPTTSAASEPQGGYEFTGLLAFEDPVREGVAEAVAACKGAGIHAIMVTGDHPLTAGAVAREVGLGGASPRLILGDDLEHWVKSGRGGELRQVDVIARARPAQKLLLVQTL